MSCVSGRSAGSGEGARTGEGEREGERGVRGVQGADRGVIGAMSGEAGDEEMCAVSGAVGWQALPGSVLECVYLLIRARCQRSSGKMLCPRMADETIAASSC